MDISSYLNKDYFCRKDFETPCPSDYAIVLGTTPDRMKIRAQIAAHFYHEGCCKKLILSGGVRYEDYGNKKECEILQEELLALGVPKEVMLLEGESKDTIQNMLSSMLILDQDQLIFSGRRISIITEPFHMARSVQLAKMLCPSFMEIHGYTENMEEQWEKEPELFEKEKAMILWAVQTYGKDMNITL